MEGWMRFKSGYVILGHLPEYFSSGDSIVARWIDVWKPWGMERKRERAKLPEALSWPKVIKGDYDVKCRI